MRIDHRLTSCMLAIAVATACRHEAARANRSVALLRDTSEAIVSMTDTGAIAATVGGIVPSRIARDTDSTGTGIVDGDLRPGTAASDPGSVAAATARATGVSGAIPSPTGIPLVNGLRLTSALHFPDGDRENVVSVSEVSSEGVLYRWRLEQRGHDGRLTRLTVSRL